MGYVSLPEGKYPSTFPELQTTQHTTFKAILFLDVRRKDLKFWPSHVGETDDCFRAALSYIFSRKGKTKPYSLGLI